MIKKKLFTLPYAGGNRYVFNKFDKYLKKDFNIHHLELAGRGDRISENLIDNIYDMRDDLFNQIKDNIKQDYIIYGHSLGGLLGYLLTLLIEEKKLKKPHKLIISGRAIPTMKPTIIRHNLQKNEFLHSIKKLGGIPNEFFKYPELFDFFEPILRADFKAIEKFNFNEKRKLKTKISVIYGTNESFSIKKALKWQKFTKQNIDFNKFKGGHFFIFDYIKEICKIIKN